jgi:hypothetical protein
VRTAHLAGAEAQQAKRTRQSRQKERWNMSENDKLKRAVAHAGEKLAQERDQRAG